MRDDFAVFILSHGRANRVKTYDVLRKSGYTGKIYLIIDNEDDQEPEYRARFENVIVFNKVEYLAKSDTFTNEDIHNIVLPARNACHDIAKQLGLKYFLELDDDYSQLKGRTIKNEKFTSVDIKNADALFEECLKFLDSGNIKAFCFSQGGDYIGGFKGKYYGKGLVRKAMNVFFCRTDRPFKFYGYINEDTTAYTLLGSRGDLFFSTTVLQINQEQTQSNASGLTDIYKEKGTYIKSFLSVMAMPSAVKVHSLQSFSDGKGGHSRLHHHIDWNHCVPCIIDQKYKKL